MKHRRILSLLLALVLAVGMLPACAAPAAAAEPMPNFLGFAGQLRWDHVPGADNYRIRGLTSGVLVIRDDGSSMYGSKTWNDDNVVFNLLKYMDASGDFEEKTYHLTFYAASGNTSLGYESAVDYEYKSALPRLETPKNLRWDGKKISWDPVEGAEYYFVTVMDAQSDSSVWRDTPKEPGADLSTTSRYASNPPVRFQADRRYYYKVQARILPGNAMTRTARDGAAAVSEAVLGSEVLSGYKGVSAPHSITVEGGTADPETALRGHSVRIKAAPKDKYAFDHWEVVSGDVTIDAPKGNDVTFIMGAQDVVIRANYRYIGGYVTEVQVYADPPEAGGTPKAATVKSDRYTVTSTTWKDSATGAVLGDGDTFEAGKTYEMDVILASADLPFAEALSGWVNDSAEGVSCQQKGAAVAAVTARFTVALAYYTVQFDPNGGSGTMEPVQVKPGEKLRLPDCPFTPPAGKVFDRWIAGYPGEEAEIGGDSIIRAYWKDADEKTNPFVDVRKADDFYTAVLWAYYHEPQITNGMDATHFGPMNTVTRGQAVTFLWRAMGCPEPKDVSSALKFTDLRDDYYKKAIAWAAENGVTNGVSDTLFAPDDTLTTAHIVTFLYRAHNPGENGWYEGAAAWAKERGCLDDLEIAVDNRTDCPRAHVVMLLFRLMG